MPILPNPLRLLPLFLSCTGCAHFSTVPGEGPWQHPQVKGDEAEIVDQLRAMDKIPGWKFVLWTPDKHRAQLTFTTPHGFVDDIVVHLGGTQGVSQLMIASRSRTGWYDFGQNRRHVRQLIAHLSTSFTIVNAHPNQRAPSENVRVLEDDDLQIRRLPEE